METPAQIELFLQSQGEDGGLVDIAAHHVNHPHSPGLTCDTGDNTLSIVDQPMSISHEATGEEAVSIQDIGSLTGVDIISLPNQAMFQLVSGSDGNSYMQLTDAQMMQSHSGAGVESIHESSAEATLTNEAIAHANPMNPVSSLINVMPKKECNTLGARLLEGQVIQLEDGTTGLIQASLSGGDVQSVQLEDGSTAYISLFADTHNSPLTIDTDPSHLHNIQVMGEDQELEGGTLQIKEEHSLPATATTEMDSSMHSVDDGSSHLTNANDLAHATSLAHANLAHANDLAHTNNLHTNDLAHTSIDHTNLDHTSLDHTSIDHTGEIDLTPHVNSNGEITSLPPGSSSQPHLSIQALAMGERAYRCEHDNCGRLYTTQHHLKVHFRSHTGDKPFKCEFPGCGKSFATGYGLKSHTRVHTGEKPYRCGDSNCTKAFKTSGDLQKHIRTHTGERPFKCPFEGCERMFTTSNIRKVHIRTHTGERPYICDQDGCNKTFASATNYKNHIRIHTGEKPYVCTVEGCGKRFTEYSSLYKHHVVHTQSKPYICNHCNKTYRQTSTLAMHKRTIHNDHSMDGEDPFFNQINAVQIVSGVTDGIEAESGTLVISNPENTTPEASSVGDVLPGLPNHSPALLQHLQPAINVGGLQQVYFIGHPSQMDGIKIMQAKQDEVTEGGLDSKESFVTVMSQHQDINAEDNSQAVTTFTIPAEASQPPS